MRITLDKVKWAAKRKKLAIENLANEAGINRATLYRQLKNGTVDNEVLRIICKTLNVNPEDLMEPDAKDKMKIAKVALEKHREQKKVPLYDVEVSSSQVEMYDDKPEILDGYVSIPGLEDCDMFLINYGDSMYPTYKSGEAIGIKRINDLDVILYGECYLIKTRDYRMIKRILKSENAETILCVSDNEEHRANGNRKYDSFELHKSKIEKLYLVKGSYRKNQI